MDIDLLNAVPGGPELVAWFGYAPRFHDAEVLAVTLDRAQATCSVRVHGFEMTSEVDSEGFFVCAKHAIVTFVLRNVTELQLDGFNHQNALIGLDIERGPEAQFRMTLDPAYGLGGVVDALGLEIAFEPGIPAGSQYLRQSAGSTVDRP